MNDEYINDPLQRWVNDELYKHIYKPAKPKFHEPHGKNNFDPITSPMFKGEKLYAYNRRRIRDLDYILTSRTHLNRCLEMN